MPKSTMKRGLKLKKREGHGVQSFFAEYGLVIGVFLAFNLVGVFAVGVGFLFPQMALQLVIFVHLASIVTSLFAFVMGSIFASREGNFISADYLESLGGLRFILIFLFLGLYIQGYILLWLIVQIGCAIRRPKKYLPWLFLQAYPLILHIVLFIGVVVFWSLFRPPVRPQPNANAGPIPQQVFPPLNQPKFPPVQMGDPFKKDINDPFKKDVFDDPRPKNEQPAPAALTGDPAVDAALSALAGVDYAAAQNAAEFFVNTPPNQHRAAVAKQLAEMALNPKLIRRMEIARALGAWATPAEVPALIQIATDKGNPFSRKEAIDALGKLRDERAVQPLVACFQDFGTRGAAEKALRAMGPIAEPGVLPLLNGNDNLQKQAVIKLLKDIGTQRSVPALQAIAFGNFPFLRMPAQEALNAIALRMKK